MEIRIYGALRIYGVYYFKVKGEVKIFKYEIPQGYFKENVFHLAAIIGIIHLLVINFIHK